MLKDIFSKSGQAAPQRLAIDLTKFFQAEEAIPSLLLTPHYKAITEYFGLPVSDPLVRTGLRICEAMDRDHNLTARENGYHNVNHMLEVPTITALLISLHEQSGFLPKLSLRDKALLIVTAFSHDLGHNGKGNGMGETRIPFLTEDHSIDLATPFFVEEYAGHEDIQFEEDFMMFKALLRSTDIGGANAPGKFVANIAAYRRGDKAELPKPEAYELKAFSKAYLDHPKLAEMGCILQDADLIPSIGLTIDWATLQEHRMGAETPSRLQANGDVNWSGTTWFHQNLACLKSQAGQRFSENFEVIKNYAVQKLSEQTLQP